MIIYYYRRSAAKNAAEILCGNSEGYNIREVLEKVPSFGSFGFYTDREWHCSIDFVMRFNDTTAKLSAFEVEGEGIKITYAYVIDDGDNEDSYEARCEMATPSEILKAYGAMFDDSCPVLLSQATDDQLALELNLRGWKGELERTDIRHLQV